MSTFPGPNWKPSATKRKIEKKARTLQRAGHERKEKGKVRKRDGYRCRFPLCGCGRLGLKLEALPEVSHSKHKGAGGNPDGSRSLAELMVQLCKHRHQTARISMHAGTLRAKYLTSALFNGPIAWEVDTRSLGATRALGPARWRVVAKETAPGKLEPLTLWQTQTLEQLARMED